jgi:hypothetical protein
MMNNNRDPGNAFLTGMAGCLGVGAAIGIVIILLVVFLALASHH